MVAEYGEEITAIEVDAFGMEVVLKPMQKDFSQMRAVMPEPSWAMALCCWFWI